MPGAEFSSFGALDSHAHQLLADAQTLASHHRQPLSSTHVVVAALQDPANADLIALVGNDAAVDIRRLLQGALSRTSEQSSEGDGATKELHACVENAHREANGSHLSPYMILWAVLSDPASLAGAIFHGLGNGNVLNEKHILDVIHREFEQGAHSADNAQVRRRANELIKVVEPTVGHWWAETHGTLRNEVLNILCRKETYKHGDFPVISGMPGTPIEHFDQVLADYLADGKGMLGTHRQVIRIDLDALRRLVDIPGASEQAAYDTLKDELEDIVHNKAVLILDNAEVLDPDQVLNVGGSVERGLRALLADPGDALVVAFYREGAQYPLKRDGILALRNAKHKQLHGYDPNRARVTIYDHFVPHWEKVLGCTCASNAFESVFAIEPWVWIDDDRRLLPYLAVFLGRDTIRSLNEGGEAEVKRLADGALNHLSTLRGKAARTEGLDAFFAPIFNNADAGLRELVLNPLPPKHDGKHVITRAHLEAQLLGAGSHEIRLPESVPAEGLAYQPEGPSTPKDVKDRPSGGGKKIVGGKEFYDG